MFWIMKILTWLPFVVLFPCKMVGRKNIPKGKAIIVCNHRSNLDYVYLFTKIWRKQFVLSKDSLYKNWFARKFFLSCGGIPVNREKVGITTIKSSLKVLSNNKILTIFPEGTRNKTNKDLLEFKSGASLFAIKSNAPIIPMFIQKTGKVFRKNKVVVGKPLYFDESFKGEDGAKRANEIIKEKMLELKDKKPS